MTEATTSNFAIYEIKHDDPEQSDAAYLQYRRTGHVFAEFADMQSARRARDIADRVLMGQPLLDENEDIFALTMIRNLFLATEFEPTGFEDREGYVLLRYCGKRKIKWRKEWERA